MSALALDEFALEMRRHYIVTTLESLSRAQSLEDFWDEVTELLPGWISEARSNDMEFFAKTLEEVKKSYEAGAFADPKTCPKLAKLLSDYLGILGTQADSEVYFKKFNESLAGISAPAVQLYLECVRGGHHFVVPVIHVIEIVSHRKVFPLPKSQPGVQGLMSFRGQGIPVLNLSDFGFSSEVKSGDDPKTSFVVCSEEESFFALEVHSTEDVREIHPSQFQNCSESSVLSPVVDKFVTDNEKSLMLLDIKKLVKHE